MEDAKLVVAKVELRFDTNGTYKDVLPLVHKYMQEQLGRPVGSYAVNSYECDQNDQDARVVGILLSLPRS